MPAYFDGDVAMVNGRIGINDTTPDADIHLKQSASNSSGAGGMIFESSTSTDKWKLVNTGVHFSFAENGVRQAYVQSNTGAWIQTSDGAKKKNVANFETILPDVLKLRPVHYT